MAKECNLKIENVCTWAPHLEIFLKLEAHGLCDVALRGGSSFDAVTLAHNNGQYSNGLPMKSQSYRKLHSNCVIQRK